MTLLLLDLALGGSWRSEHFAVAAADEAEAVEALGRAEACWLPAARAAGWYPHERLHLVAAGADGGAPEQLVAPGAGDLGAWCGLLAARLREKRAVRRLESVEAIALSVDGLAGGLGGALALEIPAPRPFGPALTDAIAPDPLDAQLAVRRGGALLPLELRPGFALTADGLGDVELGGLIGLGLRPAHERWDASMDLRLSSDPSAAARLRGEARRGWWSAEAAGWSRRLPTTSAGAVEERAWRAGRIGVDVGLAVGEGAVGIRGAAGAERVGLGGGARLDRLRAEVDVGGVVVRGPARLELGLGLLAVSPSRVDVDDGARIGATRLPRGFGELSIASAGEGARWEARLAGAALGGNAQRLDELLVGGPAGPLALPGYAPGTVSGESAIVAGLSAWSPAWRGHRFGLGLHAGNAWSYVTAGDGEAEGAGRRERVGEVAVDTGHRILADVGLAVRVGGAMELSIAQPLYAIARGGDPLGRGEARAWTGYDATPRGSVRPAPLVWLSAAPAARRGLQTPPPTPSTSFAPFSVPR